MDRLSNSSVKVTENVRVALSVVLFSAPESIEQKRDDEKESAGRRR